MTAKEYLERQAAQWDANGRQAKDLLGPTSLMVLNCWAYSAGGKRDGLSPLLAEFQAASEAALPKDWLDGEMGDRERCRKCGESYRVENLAVCTNCHRLYCYRCKAEAGQAANGNPACSCGGELVG